MMNVIIFTQIKLGFPLYTSVNHLHVFVFPLSSNHASFLGLVCAGVSDDLHSHLGGLWSMHILL